MSMNEAISANPALISIIQLLNINCNLKLKVEEVKRKIVIDEIIDNIINIIINNFKKAYILTPCGLSFSYLASPPWYL